MFAGKEGTSTVVLEAVADSSCRFWHFFFGMPGSLNDINVLDRSPLLHDIISGRSPAVEYEVNGNNYRIPYWLGDGIYPNHHCFIKSISNPKTRKEQMFSKAQEAKRKEIERAFGILQARFHILTVPCRLWCRTAMASVMKACVILHNLVIDYEKGNEAEADEGRNAYERPFTFTLVDRSSNACLSDEAKMLVLSKIQDSEIHEQLRNDLIEHRWNTLGHELLE